MAMVEDFSFFPNFSLYKGNINPNWKSTRELLGFKLRYMVYDSNCECKEAYVVDLFKGGKSLLGYRLAVLMHEMDPDTKYINHGKKILIRDVINLGQIPSASEGFKTYEDDRYTVGIKDDGQVIHLYIYQK